MKRLNVLVLAVSLFPLSTIGCGDNTAAGDGGDVDLAVVQAGPDLAKARDLSVAGDLSAVSDLSLPAGDSSPAGDGAAMDVDASVADLAQTVVPDLAQTPDLASPFGFTTVFTIVLENHDYKEIVGSPNAPFLNSLIAQGGLATNYKDSGTHPSLPNYLYMVGGDTLYPGLFDVDPMGCFIPFLNCFPKDVDNLGHQFIIAGIPWRAYGESMGMGETCKLTNAGPYAPKHMPFLYYSDIQTTAWCKMTQVDFGTDVNGNTTGDVFLKDLAAGKLPYMWITPNLNSDGHDPSGDPVAALKNSDAWMKTWVTKIMDSAVYKAGGVIFIVWDEAEGRNGDGADQVPMIILSPRIKAAGYTSNMPYDHASFLATVEDIFMLPRLGKAVGKQNMMEFFK